MVAKPRDTRDGQRHQDRQGGIHWRSNAYCTGRTVLRIKGHPGSWTVLVSAYVHTAYCAAGLGRQCLTYKVHAQERGQILNRPTLSPPTFTTAWQAQTACCTTRQGSVISQTVEGCHTVLCLGNACHSTRIRLSRVQQGSAIAEHGASCRHYVITCSLSFDGCAHSPTMVPHRTFPLGRETTRSMSLWASGTQLHALQCLLSACVVSHVFCCLRLCALPVPHPTLPLPPQGHRAAQCNCVRAARTLGAAPVHHPPLLQAPGLSSLAAITIVGVFKGLEYLANAGPNPETIVWLLWMYEGASGGSDAWYVLCYTPLGVKLTAKWQLTTDAAAAACFWVQRVLRVVLFARGVPIWVTSEMAIYTGIYDAAITYGFSALITVAAIGFEAYCIHAQLAVMRTRTGVPFA